MNMKFLHTVLILLFALGVKAQSDRVKNLSEVDSTIVRNDSVFVVSGGVEFFTGVNSLNYGNILYVSESGTANGEPGNIFRPFDNVSTAIQYAYNNMFGEAIVEVLDGDYNLSNIYIDSIPIQITTNGVLENFRIAGVASAIINAKKLQNFDVNGNNSVQINADTIVHGTTPFQRCFRSGAGSIIAKADVIISNSLIESVGNGTLGELTVSITANNFYANDGPWFGTGKYKTFVFNADKYYWNHLSDIVGTYQSNLDSTSIYFNVNEVIGDANGHGILYWQSDGGNGSTKNTSVFINIKKYTGQGKLIQYMNGKPGNSGKLHINIGEYNYTGAGNFLVNIPSVDLYDTLYISGNYNSTTPMYSAANFNYNIVFKNAVIKSTTASPLITSTSATPSTFLFRIENSDMRNSGATPIIDFNASKIISTRGAFSNPTIIDPQVTYVSSAELGYLNCAGSQSSIQDALNSICSQLPSYSSGELSTYFTNTPADTLSLTTSYTTYIPWQLTSVSGPSVTLSAGSDSLLLDAGKYEIHYDIQWISYTPGLPDTAYVISAIREGSGVVNKSLRKVYKQSANPGVGNHASVTYRTTIASDNTPVSLVLNGDDGSAGGHEILVEKAILYVNRIE